jgi:amino acid transporter
MLIGAPLPTQVLESKQLPKWRALAAFSPDAISSIAYANQEIYLGLVVAGSVGLAFAWPIGVAITVLLVLVALSYYQTIHGYPFGGGSYTVARENLGTTPGLVSAAALLMEYLLTAAVSLTAGVAAIASAFPALWPHRVVVALLLLGAITLANLRGTHEMSTLVSIPVYFFLFTYFPMLGYGLVRLLVDGIAAPVTAAPPGLQPVTGYLVLHTFASGCTALTGIEAISNAVPSFQPPEARNAGRTLLVMALLMGILFLGSTGLIQSLAVTAGPQETILSALGRRILGSGFLYVVIQAGTLLILAVAANTSFAGFPRLAAVLARDGFLPRQLTQLGDRLVFSNGILLLALGTGLLIVLFGGDSHALIPLFAVGVFTAFTLSQLGMVLHWRRERGTHWWLKAGLNCAGAAVTGVALSIIAISKFLEGAWIIIALTPLLVIAFASIRSHYQEVGRELSLKGLPPSLRPEPIPRVVIPVSGVHRGVIEAVRVAQGIATDVTAVYVELEPGAAGRVQAQWKAWFPDVPLAVVPSPTRALVAPILSYLDETDRQHHDGHLAAVVLPEFVPARWWHTILHNQTAWLLRAALHYRRRHLGYSRVIIDVPFYLRH